MIALLRKALFLVFLFSFFTTPVRGQQDSVSRSFEEVVRVPGEARLQEISEDSRYDYQEVKQEMTLWDRFIQWLRDLFGTWITSEGVQLFLKITAALAFVLVLVLFINQMRMGELKSALTRRGDRNLLNLRSTVITESSEKLDELIGKAIADSDYSLAVRFIYQKSLHILKDLDLINWRTDKTNHDYLYELKDHPSADYFSRLTYFYEYIDYGDFEIDEIRFKTIEKVYNRFKAVTGGQN